MLRTYITVSRAGHYTVTIKDGRRTLAQEGLLNSLERARATAAKFKADLLAARRERESNEADS